MNVCKVFGHKVKHYDDRYPICERCGAHGYYDAEQYEWKWHSFAFRALWRLRGFPRRLKQAIGDKFKPIDEIPF